jgi:auxin efflux carrier family protein
MCMHVSEERKKYIFFSGTIMQLFGVGESECSVIFVWVYALASVAVTVWSAFFMWTLS